MAVDVDAPERELSARGKLSNTTPHTAMTRSPSSGKLRSGVTEQYFAEAGQRDRRGLGSALADDRSGIGSAAWSSTSPPWSAPAHLPHFQA